MENKKDLIKIALTALILASALPVNGQAEVEVNGTLLAAGCASHGCGTLSDEKDQAAPANNQAGRDANQQPLEESQLVNALNAEGKAIYQSLDSEGKALALQLASQESYKDKNLAVKEAQRRINERRSIKR